MARIYPKPAPFAPADLTINSIAAPPPPPPPPPPPSVAPTASFTVTPSSITSNLASITLQDTSTGSPTQIEWDFTNNGSYDATGVPGESRVQAYPPGVYTIAMRATNSIGSNIATRNLTVTAPSFVTPQNSSVSLIGTRVGPETDTSDPDPGGRTDILAFSSNIELTLSSAILDGGTANERNITSESFIFNSGNAKYIVVPNNIADRTISPRTLRVTVTSSLGTFLSTITVSAFSRSGIVEGVQDIFQFIRSSNQTILAGQTGGSIPSGILILGAWNLGVGRSPAAAISISLTGGSLPPGITLPTTITWNTLYHPISGFPRTRLLSGTATTPGTYSWQMTIAYDPVETSTVSTVHNFTLTVT